MRFRVKLALGSVIALVLGLIVSLPLLFPNLQLTTRIEIDVDVVYAYFDVPDFGSNITGLWKNFSEPQDYYSISYFIVLNITNPSDSIASVSEFEVAVAPEILVQNGTELLGSKKLALQSSKSNSEFAVSMQNPIIHDVRITTWLPGWSQYWSPHESRLIGLTGMVDIWNIAYQETLANGTMYLYGEAEGRPVGGGAQTRGFSLNHVQLQKMGRESLYNAILAENQIFRIDGLDVHINTRP
jgi:hypothetical protein